MGILTITTRIKDITPEQAKAKLIEITALNASAKDSRTMTNATYTEVL